MMGLLNKRVRVALLAFAAVAGTAAIPSIASAGDKDGGGRYHDAHDTRGDDRGDRYRLDHRADDRRRDYEDHDRLQTDVHLDIHIGRPPYEPVCEERTTRVWIEPTYRTVCDRVWVEPVYRTECDRVWEPDRFAYRDVVYRDRHGRRVIRQERILVEPGHWRNIERQVLICEGHWESVERQELVTPGHWEYRTERVQVGERRDDAGFGIGGWFASLTRS
jgi:hypothetical protein